MDCKELVLYSNTPYYTIVLNYIYNEYNDNINQFEYLSESLLKPYEYIRRGEKNSIKTCYPTDTEFPLKFKDHDILFRLLTIYKDNNDYEKLLKPIGGCGSTQVEHIIYKKIILKSLSKEILINFVDEAKEYRENQVKETKHLNKKTIKINIWRKEYWNLLFKSPKRPLETLYLKKGQKEDIIKNIGTFFDPDTRADYLSYGIPYKCVYMLYGVPGSGKTSTINTIASYFDCDIYAIPISKELTDYMLIDAISYIEDKEDKKKVIVIEDIDSIFTNRKKGDDENGITLQGILNCLDGFSCIEGTLLFITANNPEILDQALIRSCRIDYKYELGYADKYQTECIFCKLFPQEKENFKKFYNLIKNKEYTTAMLQEFLFFNRRCDDIYSKIELFYKIIQENNPTNYNKDKNDLYL